MLWEIILEGILLRCVIINSHFHGSSNRAVFSTEPKQKWDVDDACFQHPLSAPHWYTFCPCHLVDVSGILHHIPSLTADFQPWLPGTVPCEVRCPQSTKHSLRVRPACLYTFGSRVFSYECRSPQYNQKNRFVVLEESLSNGGRETVDNSLISIPVGRQFWEVRRPQQNRTLCLYFLPHHFAPFFFCTLGEFLEQGPCHHVLPAFERTQTKAFMMDLPYAASGILCSPPSLELSAKSYGNLTYTFPKFLCLNKSFVFCV